MLEQKLLGIHGDLLRLRSEKTEIIAKNLANSNTPGYKAMDIDIRNNLDVADNKKSAIKMTNPRHISKSSVGAGLASEVMYRMPNQTSLDGNTVETDQEIVRLSENSIRYQYSLKYASDKIKMINNILKDI